jgi:hypothetical protein
MARGGFAMEDGGAPAQLQAALCQRKATATAGDLRGERRRERRPVWRQNAATAARLTQRGRRRRGSSSRRTGRRTTVAACGEKRRWHVRAAAVAATPSSPMAIDRGRRRAHNTPKRRGKSNSGSAQLLDEASITIATSGLEEETSPVVGGHD